MRQSIILLGAMLAVVGCNEAADTTAANTGDATAAQKPKPKYCFFTDAETKGWSASRDKQGNVVVKGQAYRSDPRYQAQLGAAEVSGTTAVIRPSIVPNTTGYAALENWWDISATIPNSGSVETVQVECGPKTLAELNVPPAKAS